MFLIVTDHQNAECALNSIEASAMESDKIMIDNDVEKLDELAL